MTTLKAEAHVRCFAGCSGRLPLTLAEPRCATCHGLLEVVHDEDALAARPAAEWRELFDARAGAGLGLDGSGVWGFREWVLPGIAPAHVVTLGEGKTPLVHAARYGAAIGLPDLYVKQCGTSHSGSFKDLGMTVLVSAVVSGQAAGALTARAVACASTGDTSAALAAYGAAAGVPVVVLLPRGKVSTAQLVQPLAHVPGHQQHQRPGHLAADDALRHRRHQARLRGGQVGSAEAADARVGLQVGDVQDVEREEHDQARDDHADDVADLHLPGRAAQDLSLIHI